jgi:hypothetical protein
MGKIVLVTGCSSGIGADLVPLLVDSGYRVVATALPTSMKILNKFPFIKDSNVMALPLDIREHQSFEPMLEIIRNHWGEVDILINNAGISYRGVVEDMDLEDELHQQYVNYLGPMQLIRKVLPSMRAMGSGKIINISSVSGMMAMPTMSSYSASKFALEGASEALWYEVKPFGIDITCVQPGFINSIAFQKVFKPQKGQSNSYLSHYKYMAKFVEKMMTKTPTTSQKVAQKIVKVVNAKNPPLRVAGSFDAWLFYLIRRFLPRSIYHPILYRTLPGISKWGHDV